MVGSAELDDALRSIVESVDPSATIQKVAPLSGGLSYQLRRISTDRGELVLREASDVRAGRWGLKLHDEYQLIEQLGLLSLPVPNPRLFDDSGTVLKHPFAVYDFIEGSPLLHADDAGRVGEAVAVKMAAVHSLDLERLDTSALPYWRQFATEVLAKSPEVFDDSVDEETVRKALNTHWPPTPPSRDCLLHGDFWPGNIIEHHGEIVGILDWENASLGDPMTDVAITRLDLLWSFGVKATTSFTAAYRQITSCDTTSLALWDLFAALRPAGDLKQWAAEYPGIGRPDITFETMQAGHRWFVSQALAALA